MFALTCQGLHQTNYQCLLCGRYFKRWHAIVLRCLSGSTGGWPVILMLSPVLCPHASGGMFTTQG